jgi:hypothetical protein
VLLADAGIDKHKTLVKMMKKSNVGDWVEVRSKEEILRTLDDKGELDGMPFMPEMFQFCGKRFQVYKRAHKTCDYATPYPYRTRRLESSVHLETRCDGGGHSGCQAGCLINWKEAWLKPVAKDSKHGVLTQIETVPGKNGVSGGGCTEAAVFANTQVVDASGQLVKYKCQATEVPAFTTFLKWWDVRQYLEDYFSGNVGLWRMFRGFTYSTYYNLSQSGIGLGPAMRWLYDKLSPLWGGPKWPRTPGLIPEGSPTPAANLNLQPGEWVRVKSQEEILKMVTTDNKNRGMFWDAELVPYCGGTYQVLRRVNKLIDEKTGKMMDMKTACIVLDSVVCQARYSPYRYLCPKEMYPYWREIWLERVEVPNSAPQSRIEETESAMAGSAR